MSNSTSSSTLSMTAGSKLFAGATIALVAVALLYAASGLANAFYVARVPWTVVLRQAILTLLPSVTVVAALWITRVSGLSPAGRRIALTTTLLASGCVAVISTFGG